LETIGRHRDEGPAHWTLNGLMVTKAAVDETGGAFGLMEHVLTAACNPPVHVHTDEEECFYVLDGEIEFEVDGEKVDGRPGTFALVPRGAVHTFRVLTETARMLVICSGKPTNNLEDFFLGMGEPATERALPTPSAPDEARLVTLAARTGIEIVG